MRRYENREKREERERKERKEKKERGKRKKRGAMEAARVPVLETSRPEGPAVFSGNLRDWS